MAGNGGLFEKWCAFWRALEEKEKLVIMRMVGYTGAYPASGVSPLLIARLLRKMLYCCHKRDGRK